MRAFTVLAQTIGVLAAVIAGPTAAAIYTLDPATIQNGQTLAALALAIAAVGLVTALVAREARR